MASQVEKTVEEKEGVVIRFAGDSGDGMQLLGDRFTSATAILGNDLATLPDFPAEIRAPAGTLAGVSAFQIHFAARDIGTPGDAPNVLVALNPAALRVNIKALAKGGVVVANQDAFLDRNLEKAGYSANPLVDGSLEGYQVFAVPMTSMTLRATQHLGLTKKDAERARTCSRWACCRGCTAARPTSPSRGSNSASPRSPSFWTRTCRRSRPATTSARPPSCSRITTP